MLTIEIAHYKGLNYTPAVCLATKVQAELIASGKSEPLLSVGWDDNAIVASINEKEVGLITWRYIEWIRTVNIHLGWVDPEYRRNGIYSQMWRELVQKARDLEAKCITGTTHMDNYAMRKVARSMGRVEISINLSYRL